MIDLNKSNKNYLFAPFKDDDEKISAFNHLKNNQDHKQIHELVMFIGRLESYYDVIITDKEKVWIELCNSKVDREYHRSEVKRLESEIKTTKENGLHLLNEIKELKADIRHDTKVCDDYDDDLIKEIDELKAEMRKQKKISLQISKERIDTIKELKADIRHDTKVCDDYDDDLIKEINELKADKCKHYPKEYREEAKEYFSHNPNGEKLWFFMVGDSEVDEDGDIRKTLNVGVDAIAECDNFNGDISVEVYK